jgi:hypothetical protein
MFREHKQHILEPNSVFGTNIFRKPLILSMSAPLPIVRLKFPELVVRDAVMYFYQMKAVARYVVQLRSNSYTVACYCFCLLVALKPLAIRDPRRHKGFRRQRWKDSPLLGGRNHPQNATKGGRIHPRRWKDSPPISGRIHRQMTFLGGRKHPLLGLQWWRKPTAALIERCFTAKRVHIAISNQNRADVDISQGWKKSPPWILVTTKGGRIHPQQSDQSEVEGLIDLASTIGNIRS